MTTDSQYFEFKFFLDKIQEIPKFYHQTIIAYYINKEEMHTKRL